MENEKQKFEAYRNVQKSGLTNMFDAHAVIRLAKERCDVVLERSDITWIMGHYNELREKYEHEETSRT